mgnify:CR=1 FL=1
MAFDSLSEKLQNVFKNLRSKGRLTEDDVKLALKEVKMALLEADVNFKVVKQSVKVVQEAVLRNAFNFHKSTRLLLLAIIMRVKSAA